MKNKKIIFFGTPKFAEVILGNLIAAGYNVAAVFSQPDKKIGRRQEVIFSPVKKLALEKGLKVFQPDDLQEIGMAGKIKEIGADLFVVAAYGKILPGEILKIPKYGAINIHASLLPKYRGASPIQEAILAGDKKTGVTLMLMNEKMDAGEIILQKEILIRGGDDACALSEKISKIAGKLLIETLPSWIAGKIKTAPQNENEAAYCRIIKKEDGKINWNDAAEKIFRMGKAYCAWPGIFTFLPSKKGKKRLKILEISAISDENIGEIPGKVLKYKGKIAVQTGKGLVFLKKIQLEGKKETSAEDFSKGHRDFLNCVLT